jgi:CIC family chloride channel protein
MKLYRKASMRTFRSRLASFDSIPQFALLGIVSGIITGLVIIAFRLAIEWPLSRFLPGGAEDFESLSPVWLLALPAAGAAVLIPIMLLISESDRRVGVIHVLERLARHQGHMPEKNILVQFITGVIALGSGQSGGREGPAIHLGAAGSSLLGHYLSLPNNSIRVLVGCGAAAAIAASFNTPIAGVIFSMEVIIMEYTIAGFIPVILASVVAALLTQLVFGSATAFDVPPVSVASLLDLPILISEGVLIGAVAALFIRIVLIVSKHAPSPIWIRLLIAGGLTSIAALISPEVLGVGYDTVNLALIGEIGFGVLVTSFLIKVLLSSTVIALGMPVGIIGPTLFIGAMAGGLFALVAGMFDQALSEDALYVMLGMGAMMGAVLQAPLAALMAVLELTNNPNIILPAMLVIIIANMTASQVFGMRSVFQMQMEAMGLEFRQNPLSMALNRASIASIMVRSYERIKRYIPVEVAREAVANGPIWLLVEEEDRGFLFILRTEDLEHFLKEDPPDEIDLASIPATRKDVTGILLQATLNEALDALNNANVQALYVNRISAPMLESPVGIVTREDIENYYKS